MQHPTHIQFADFELDLDTRELRRNGQCVKLSPKPFQVLAILTGSPGRLVSREALRKELWDSDTYVDFEHALNFCIREVRAALHDNPRKPLYIETLPRRGYRFVAETRTNRAGAAANTGGAEETRQIEAYRCYQRARQSFGQAGKEALEQSRLDFERALEILPGYAMAHSGLGAAHALRSLNRRHPEDLEAARAHLTQALELDPELAEPYPWLCYVLMRQNKPADSLRAGLRGVRLQPDLAQAHYFLGLTYVAGAEQNAANYQHAVTHLLDAARVGPHWQPTWFVLSYVALLTGNYIEAENYAGILLEKNRGAKGLPFIGAEIVLASVRLRLGDAPGARALLGGFFEKMSDSDHMYRDAMSAAAACVSGDVELRHGDSGAALAAYRRAWHAVQEHPRVMAYQRIAARAQAGLAAAYAAAGDRKRALELLTRAQQTAHESELPEHNAAAASLPELYWSIGSGWARLGDSPRAMEAIRNSTRTGWRDAAWMECDPEFRELREMPEFARLLSAIQMAPLSFEATQQVVSGEQQRA